ncbi:MAG: hypothetical protein ACOXZ4_05775 [Sphaerochaetaceae bacterium]
MRRIILLFVLGLSVLLATSCIELIQTVSIKDSVVTTSVRFVLQKSLFEFISTLTGEEMDYSEIADIGNEVISDIPGVSGRIHSFENEFDVGGEVSISAPQSQIAAIAENDWIFLPEIRGKSVLIRIPMMGDEEPDEAALAFLAGMKYRLIVSLTGDLAHITNATVHVEEGSRSTNLSDEVSIRVNGPIMIVEIPIIYLFATDKGLLVTTLS